MEPLEQGCRVVQHQSESYFRVPWLFFGFSQFSIFSEQRKHKNAIQSVLLVLPEYLFRFFTLVQSRTLCFSDSIRCVGAGQQTAARPNIATRQGNCWFVTSRGSPLVLGDRPPRSARPSATTAKTLNVCQESGDHGQPPQGVQGILALNALPTPRALPRLFCAGWRGSLKGFYFPPSSENTGATQSVFFTFVFLFFFWGRLSSCHISKHFSQASLMHKGGLKQNVIINGWRLKDSRQGVCSQERINGMTWC